MFIEHLKEENFFEYFAKGKTDAKMKIEKIDEGHLKISIEEMAQQLIKQGNEKKLAMAKEETITIVTDADCYRAEQTEKKFGKGMWKSFVYDKLPNEFKKEYKKKHQVGLKEYIKQEKNLVFDDSEGLERICNYFKDDSQLDYVEKGKLHSKIFMLKWAEREMFERMSKYFNDFAFNSRITLTIRDEMGNDGQFTGQIFEDINTVVLWIIEEDPRIKVYFYGILLKALKEKNFKRVWARYCDEPHSKDWRKFNLEKFADMKILLFCHTEDAGGKGFEKMFIELSSDAKGGGAVNIRDIALMNEKQPQMLLERVNEMINSYIEQMNRPLSYYMEKFKDRFTEIYAEKLKSYLLDKDDKIMQEKIDNYMSAEKHNDGDCLAVLTAIYTKNLFLIDERMDTVDWTSVVVGYFKAVEIMFKNLLVMFYPEYDMIDRQGKTLSVQRILEEKIDKKFRIQKEDMAFGNLKYMFDFGIRKEFLKGDLNLDKELDDFASQTQKWSDDRNKFQHIKLQTDKTEALRIEQDAYKLMLNLIKFLSK